MTNDFSKMHWFPWCCLQDFKWITPFEDRKYFSKNKSLKIKVTNLTIHINGNHGVFLKL